jgi:predicted PurR-regulated permease PerM
LRSNGPLPGRNSMDSVHQRSNIFFAFAVAAGLLLIYKLRAVLLVIYVSVLLAVVINPSVEGIERLRIGKWSPNRGTATLLSFLLVTAVFGLFAVFALPPIAHDVQQLAADWPQKSAALYERVRHLPLADRVPPASLQQQLAAIIGGIFGVLKTIAVSFASVLTGLILTLYFLLDGKRAFSWLMSIVGAGLRERLEPSFLRAERRLRRWLVGQAALMLILGSCSALVFGLLEIKYFYALAVFSGLANIVPVLGPIISVILAGVVAAFDSWGKLIGVITFYFVYQQVENAYLTPRIMKATLDLPPLAVVVALTFGGALAGIVGALVAVPTAALIDVFLDEYRARSTQGVRTSGNAGSTP